MTSVVASLLLLIITTNCVRSQEAGMDLQDLPRAVAQPVTYEAIALFGDDSASAIVNIHYRIMQQFFIFVRNEAEHHKEEFIARGELAVELLDQQRNSVARTLRKIVLTRTELPRETDHVPDIQGAFSFIVPPGNYQIVFNLDDRESGRTFMERNRSIEVRAPSYDPMEVSHPIFLQPRDPASEQQRFLPLNRGGDVHYGGRGGVVSQLYHPNTNDLVQVRWTLEGQLEGFGARKQNFAGTQYMMSKGLLTVIQQEEGLEYIIASSSRPWHVLYVPLPLEKLEPGAFTLSIEYSAGSYSKKQNHRFRVIWPKRPFSLYNLDLAIDALRHIATKEQMDEMLSGTIVKRVEAFHRFWRAKDPDTTTAYNEIMAEYYYRVDEALRKYSGVREGDGYKTDRGRIFILYGAPTETNRIFQPGGPPTEIWTYEHLRRRFIFIDPTKSGAFILSQTEEM
jgi:GWxTD domain-containing protein